MLPLVLGWVNEKINKNEFIVPTAAGAVTTAGAAAAVAVAAAAAAAAAGRGRSRRISDCENVSKIVVVADIDTWENVLNLVCRWLS